MAQQTSIHLCPCKQSSEIHNKREKTLDYVRPDLSQNNEWWSSVHSLGELRSEIAALVKEKTGRKMQAKSEPLREGVVVIRKNTTMEQLQELGRKFNERFGVTAVQIAIHRDEGHWVGKNGMSSGTKPNEQPKPGDTWRPNYHAHIVFDWYDHGTGKSIKTSKLDAVEMQTICAEVLGMERGVSSDKRHLEAAEYKAKARQKEIATLEGMAQGLREEVSELSSAKIAREETVATIRELGASARDLIYGKYKREKKELNEKLRQITERLNIAEKDKIKLSDELSSKKQTIRDLEKKTSNLAHLSNENKALRNALDSATTQRDNAMPVIMAAYSWGVPQDKWGSLISGKEATVSELRNPESGEAIKGSFKIRANAYLVRLEIFIGRQWESLKQKWAQLMRTAMDRPQNIDERKSRGMHL